MLGTICKAPRSARLAEPLRKSSVAAARLVWKTRVVEWSRVVRAAPSRRSGSCGGGATLGSDGSLGSAARSLDQYLCPAVDVQAQTLVRERAVLEV